MSKKLYFTDPIRALYMFKEFGVKFFVIFSERLSVDLISGEKSRDNEIEVGFEEFLFGMELELCEILNFEGRIYVKKESEHIFEQRKGDGKFFFMPEHEIT